MALEMREVLRDLPAPTSGCPLPRRSTKPMKENKAPAVGRGMVKAASWSDFETKAAGAVNKATGAGDMVAAVAAGAGAMAAGAGNKAASAEAGAAAGNETATAAPEASSADTGAGNKAAAQEASSAETGAGNKAAAAENKAAVKKRIRVKVSDDYIKVLLAHPPPEKPARVPTKENFKSFSPEIQERFVNRCVKVAGLLNQRRDRDLDILSQYHKSQCAYEVLEVEEEELNRFIRKGGIYEEL